MKRSFLVIGVLLLVIIGGLTVSGVVYRPDLRAPEGLKGQYIKVKGNRIRYLQTGAGQDILLIHGCPGSLEDWEPVMEDLSRKYRVTAYDRPGHGYSDATGDRYTYDYHAEVALSLIEVLHLQDVVVVGHSYGGGTALAMALRKPAQVRSLVVVDSSGHRLSKKPDPLYHLLTIPAFGTGCARLLGPLLAPGKIRRGLLAEFPVGAVPGHFIELRTKIWAQPKVTTSIAQETLRADQGLAKMNGHYKDIRHPVFIVAQADDPVRREGAERLHRDIPGAQLLLLSGTGHYIQFQKTQELIRIIEKAAGPASNRSRSRWWP